MTYRSIALILPILTSILLAIVTATSRGRTLPRLLSLGTPIALVIASLAASDGKAIRLIGSIFYGDAMTSFMLAVTAIVSFLAIVSSWSFLDFEIRSDPVRASKQRQYLSLLQIFLGAMSIAITSDNLGVIWVAVEATTISTAFLVAHKGTAKALEAAWKYVIICSFGIALAFFGTVLVYFSAIHAGISPSNALDIHYLVRGASRMHNDATRLGLGLILLGYSAKVGLVPFHTWLADAHSQAPAPVSALMSGVLLSVAFTIILRLERFSSLSVGPGLFQNGLLVMALASILTAALLMVGQKDFKRLFAYSSIENMGVIAIAGSIGTRIALYALLLQIFAHGVAKAIAFISAGIMQMHIGSTDISDVIALTRRTPMIALTLSVAMLALLGFPPFAIFSSETSIAYSLGTSGESVILVLVSLALLIGFGSLARHVGRMLFFEAATTVSTISISITDSIPLVVGIGLSLYIGIVTSPISQLVSQATYTLGFAK